MIEIGFLISILSASNFIHTPRNQIFHFQILKLHFHTEDTGGGGEGTIHHFSSLSRSASSGICQKTKSSALLIYARAATSTLNPGRQLSPAELPYPDIPWHRISSGRGGGGTHAGHLLCPTFVTCCSHKALWDVRWQTPATPVCRLAAAASGLCWCPAFPCPPPLRSRSQPFAFSWVGLLQGVYVQRLGLENQPLPVPTAYCKLARHLACGNCRAQASK